MMERFKTMSRDEQQQFISRMKERGGDTSTFESALQPSSAKATEGRRVSRSVLGVVTLPAADLAALEESASAKATARQARE